MKKELEMGTLESGRKFTLPLDFVTRTLAIIGIRGWGKTVAATVLAEEMCECGIPWIAFDPTSVWWGLRVNPDGSPGGYPVLIVGGEHGDIPLESASGGGPRLAEAILQENLCCVVDFQQESKNNWRKFVADFCDRLMILKPAVPHHIFLEEAPEFVPQKPLGEQRRSLASVDRLVRLGRNNGYGATLISQRFATVQKDVLNMCENLLAGLTIGKTDRKAVKEWIEEVVRDTQPKKAADGLMPSLAQLENGQGWFWSPQWLDVFAKVRIRRRKTFHPGETRKFGVAPKQVTLGDVKEFVFDFERLERAIQSGPRLGGRVKFQTKAEKPVSFQAVESGSPLLEPPRTALLEETQHLRGQIAELHRQLGAARAAVDAIRKVMEPEYRAMQKLFAEIDAAAAGASSRDAAVFEPWKAKLGQACARMIDALLERGQLSTSQLATLAGLAPRTTQNNLIVLRRNGLVASHAGMHELRTP